MILHTYIHTYKHNIHTLVFINKVCTNIIYNNFMATNNTLQMRSNNLIPSLNECNSNINYYCDLLLLFVIL